MKDLVRLLAQIALRNPAKEIPQGCVGVVQSELNDRGISMETQAPQLNKVSNFEFPKSPVHFLKGSLYYLWAHIFMAVMYALYTVLERKQENNPILCCV